LTKYESAVVSHKIYDGIELLVDEARLIADYSYTDYCVCLNILMVNLRNGYIKPALEPTDHALNDTPFALERSHTRQGKMRCHNTDNHV
jgi:hypothetical protein